MSSPNDGECLRLTKVSSLMAALFLAFAEPCAPSLIKDLVAMVTTPSIWVCAICQTPKYSSMKNTQQL